MNTNTNYLMIYADSGNVAESFYAPSVAEAKKIFNSRWRFNGQTKSDVKLVKLQIINM